MNPSKRLETVIESQTLAMTKLARELKEQGKDIISLSIGEPDFDTPENICEAATNAMNAGQTHYTPVAGTLELRNAICQKLKRDNYLDFTANEIIVSNGAKQSLWNAVLSIINPGDEVILPAPFWVSYPSMVTYAGGVSIQIEGRAENNYKVTAEQLSSHITDKTKLIMFSSPCNPSGYAMTGWRIGYLAGPADLVKACEKIQGLITSGANSVAQAAGVEALNGNQDSVSEMKVIFEKRRNLMFDKLSEIEGLHNINPDGAFYHFPDVSHFLGKSYNGHIIGTSDELCLFILEVTGVSIVAGTAFGSPNCIRLSYATSEDLIIESVSRIAKALSLLN